MTHRSLGLDVGAETVRVAWLEGSDDRVRIEHLARASHAKDPHSAARELLSHRGLHDVRIAATGRLKRVVRVEPVPAKAAVKTALRLLRPELEAVTLLSIGAHGFSVLELHQGGQEWFRQNSRCSQGTGSFLTQLVERFGLSIRQASELCDDEDHPATLSGRCPVILKTDMTHLANKGESRSRILAGLYDAVCENVLTLVRPALAPRDVLLLGGVTGSARVRRKIGAWLAERGMRLCAAQSEDEYLEAIGTALHATRQGQPSGAFTVSSLLGTAQGTELERTAPLRDALRRVQRLPAIAREWHSDTPRAVFVGLDIGSTGSKAVAVDASAGTLLWETYLNTEGAPVTAAQRLMARFDEELSSSVTLVGFGVTGSGREIVGSLLSTCYGAERVFVLNEIAAHARGACELDPQVDTIFEIGGQDAKYIRLEGGRVIDAAMNEACSAGTGSFIAEQGAKFEGVGHDVRRMAELALSADAGISLGQHCSVFMAEVIDEAITQGADAKTVIAGLYDSVIQNYLNRVKGTRSIGERIFCQGMPFSSDALAAAVARQTGRDVVVPPNPGTIGALGIALLTRDEKGEALRSAAPMAPAAFLSARVVAKECITCHSTKGCGGAGNHCRIDRLQTEVNGKKQKFLWGGNCSLYDRGMGRGKLPDRALDPFKEREALLDALIVEHFEAGTPVVALSDEFALKNLAPLFIVFLQELGLSCRVVRRADKSTLRRGIERARVPYCAPVQMVHGVARTLSELGADYVLLPRIASLPRVSGEEHAVVCPMVVASPDLLQGVTSEQRARVLAPCIDFDGEGYMGRVALGGLRELAAEVGRLDRFEHAAERAAAAQLEFDRACVQIGERALAFCKEHDVVPVAVLGRPYTIYNDVLNSNVPNILRSLGAMAIPVDCLPVPEEIAPFDSQYWAHAQRNLRAADFVRQTPGLYSVFCSNYACGPDSFTLHFYAYSMQNKPFAVVETDGHSGDAGTKTRMEAFLYCVDTDRRSRASESAPRADFRRLERATASWTDAKKAGATVLLPRMGTSALVAGAALRAEGFRAKALPLSTREDVRQGRRYTSGKECVPMMLTLGTLLNEIERDRDDRRNYAFFMPTAHGPCRFGVYHGLHKIALERAGYGDRVSIISPDDADYFSGMSADFSARLWLGFVVHDLLQAMLLDVRPAERSPGAADAVWKRSLERLVALLEKPAGGSIWKALWELSGNMWGLRALLEDASDAFARIPRRSEHVPSVALVGEIYVRLDPFANDFIVEKLEARGLAVRFAPFIEWLEYSNDVAVKRLIAGNRFRTDEPLAIGVSALVQKVTSEVLYRVCARRLGWPARTTVSDTLRAARPYIHPALTGEAALSLGGPLHEFNRGHIEGVVMVGPHECMPCKIAEAQFGTASENTNVPYLAVDVTGDPIDTELLDRFAYDIHHAHERPRAARRRRVSLPVINSALAPRRPSWRASEPS